MNAAVAIEKPVLVQPELARIRLILALAAFGALWFILCRHLSSEWSLNEQYSYGWFMPLFCAYLFWLRWQDRPKAEGREQRAQSRTEVLIAIATAAPALLLLFSLRLFEIANPD